MAVTSSPVFGNGAPRLDNHTRLTFAEVVPFVAVSPETGWPLQSTPLTMRLGLCCAKQGELGELPM